jgi:hypothetical protein
MATREELAWAAGFFDGEGCVGCSRGAPTKLGVQRRYLRAAVTQKHPPLLEKFAALFDGGAIRAESRRTMHQYQANGKDAFRVICALWPWLGEQKKADFKRALRAIKESRALAARTTAPPRECAAPDCANTFVPDIRHVDTAYCSNRCFQRINARRRRGPAPPKFCLGCRCPVDDRTRGCKWCSKRHWQRQNKRGD